MPQDVPREMMQVRIVDIDVENFAISLEMTQVPRGIQDEERRHQLDTGTFEALATSILSLWNGVGENCRDIRKRRVAQETVESLKSAEMLGSLSVPTHTESLTDVH